MMVQVGATGQRGRAFCLSFAATAEDVSQQLRDLGQSFAAEGFPEAVCENVMIVLGEVCNNIVEHATERQDRDIGLRITEVRGRLHIETRDRGHALPTRLLGMPDLPEIGESTDDLPEGGFGWFIIHSLVDDMTYERDKGMNCLSFSVACP